MSRSTNFCRYSTLGFFPGTRLCSHWPISKMEFSSCSGSTTVVLTDEEGKPYIKNVPSGPPIPISYTKYDLYKPEPEGELMARAVADCLLLIEKE